MVDQIDPTILSPDSPDWPYPTAQTLLPPNATEFEKDVEQGLLLRNDTVAAIDALRGIKFNPPDELLPWLVWEYGLTGIVPYLDDLRLAIREGLLWQKERGTESAVRRALGWIDIFPDAFEHETPGVHWNEFQIDTGRVPTREELRGIIALSDMSSPARSKLRRLYHGCDRRRFVFSESDWGDLLADYSGVRPAEYGGLLALNFCHHESTGVTIEPSVEAATWLLVGEEVGAYRFPLLGEHAVFGEAPIMNHDSSVYLTLNNTAQYESAADSIALFTTGNEVQCPPAELQGVSTFIQHSNQISFAPQASSGVQLQIAVASEPYTPTWRETSWTQQDWSTDIRIESDYT